MEIDFGAVRLSNSPEHAVPRGYALLATLWICAALSASSLACLAAAREAIALSRNRAALIHAEWEAVGCLSRARALLAVSMGKDNTQFSSDRLRTWRNVDAILAGTIGPCTITAEPSGMRLDINTADEEVLVRALRNAGRSEALSDSLAAAILDWIDADDDPRPNGAERGWYGSHGLTEPPNRPLIHMNELRGVRGLTNYRILSETFGTESGAIAFSHAPFDVLRLVPGVTDQLAAHIVRLRSRGVALRSFADLGIGLSGDDQRAISDALPQLARTTTLYPDQWVLTVRFDSSGRLPDAVIHAHVQRGTDGVDVVLQQMSIQ